MDWSAEHGRSTVTLGKTHLHYGHPESEVPTRRRVCSEVPRQVEVLQRTGGATSEVFITAQCSAHPGPDVRETDWRRRRCRVRSVPPTRQSRRWACRQSAPLWRKLAEMVSTVSRYCHRLDVSAINAGRHLSGDYRGQHRAGNGCARRPPSRSTQRPDLPAPGTAPSVIDSLC